MKRFICLLTAFSILLSTVALGETTPLDARIFSDGVNGTYYGRTDGQALIKNLNFSDVDANHWAKESIVRTGSLNLVKGDGTTFRPSGYVTNEEALAFILRVINMEGRAVDEAVAIRSGYGEDETTRNLWSIGYMSLARKLGIISNMDYQSLTQLEVDSESSGLLRTDPVTRERVAYWLVLAINIISPSALGAEENIQRILNFSDWDKIDIEYVKSVEALVRNGIFSGDDTGRFNPKSGLTRAEMAQVLRKMDTVYNNLNQIVKKTGTVGGIKDSQQTQTGSGSFWRDFYIRAAGGEVDIVRYQMSQANPALNDIYADTVVYKDNMAQGLIALQEGDEIEYLIDSVTLEVMYIQVLTKAAVKESVEGVLSSADVKAGTITIVDDSGRSRTYNLMAGLYNEEALVLVIDGARNLLSTLPYGSRVRLNMINRAVESINYIGEPVLITELRGIVVENNTDFGYLTVYTNDGKLVTKNYYADSIKVEKQQYYDLDDEIGYLDEVFTSYKYDPRDTYIEDIEPGDIVFMRFDPDDPNLISNISASTNYVAKYGKIVQMTSGEGITRYLVEYENKQTNWFDVADNIFVSRLGRPIGGKDVKVGDWAKFLVNQAIISPGYIMESVKEINIEGDEHYISTIIKGQLAGIDVIQKKLMVQNAQTLEKSGWGNYQNIQQISIAGNDIEYYYNGTRISLDYAERYLKRSTGDVYIALENNPSGERAAMITFRDGRDELLSADTVITSDGNGGFSVLSNSGDIMADTGTIVRRYGRLVNSNNILPSDYTVVSLNGGNTAAVVDISDAPDTTGVFIARGRILSVDDGKSFKVQSMSVLSGNEWVFTPVQREFAIDYSTLFINSEGISNIDQFIDYTEASVVDKVYNIVYEGSKAVRVIDSPYSKNIVKGDIYQISGNEVSLRNAQVYNNDTGAWTPVSLTNATITVTLPTNAIVVKNNSAVSERNLVVGDSIRVFTDNLPEKVTSGLNVNGYMAFVDK